MKEGVTRKSRNQNDSREGREETETTLTLAWPIFQPRLLVVLPDDAKKTLRKNKEEQVKKRKRKKRIYLRFFFVFAINIFSAKLLGSGTFS
jgi:hypothetical protein